MVSVIEKYLSRWAAAQGSVEAYDELRLLTFEFIIKVGVGVGGQGGGGWGEEGLWIMMSITS
jgi:hypothetical protein